MKVGDIVLLPADDGRRLLGRIDFIHPGLGAVVDVIVGPGKPGHPGILAGLVPVSTDILIVVRTDEANRVLVGGAA